MVRVNAGALHTTTPVWAAHGVVSVDASYFTLIGKDNRSYRFLSSDMISVNLQPGTETEGRVSFKTRSLPQKLIFANDNIGTISRLFP